MFYPEFTKDYIRRVMTHPDRYAEDAQSLIGESIEKRRLYHGMEVPMTYQGMFLTPQEVETFQEMIRTMVSIGRKVTAEYVKNPAYRKGFHFDAAMEELILLDPGYDMPVPVGRYDIFYRGGGDYRFCELNTDGASAMNEDRVLGDLLLQSRIMQDMQKDWSLSRFSLFDSLVSVFLDRYRKIRGREAKSVAIVDVLDKGTRMEFDVYRDRFAAAGVRAVVADVRDLRFADGKLWAKDEKGEPLAIDLVYRRLVTSDFLAVRKEAKAFEEAYRAGAFLSFGSFRSQVMHAKTTFAMLHKEETLALLTPEEREFIARRIPMTWEITTPEDKSKVIEKKDAYILKPYNSYGSQGVVIGRDHTQNEWETVVNALPYAQYIAQEFVDNDPTPFLCFQNDPNAADGDSEEALPIVKSLDDTKTVSFAQALKDAETPETAGPFVVKPFGHVLGCFLFDEQFAGCYVRIGQHNMISGLRDYFTAPTFVVTRRDRIR